MPTFRYKAYDSIGKTIAGSLEASGLKDAAQQIKNTGLFPAEIKETEGAKGKQFGLKKGITAQMLALTTRQLATLLSTGTNLSEALTVLCENTSNEKLKAVLQKVRETVVEGSSFARALEAHPTVFSPFYRGLVTAGEASGSLDKVLPRLADYLEARAKILNDVKAALTYPILMSLVGIGVLSFLFIFVIPKITRMFEETQNALPLITQVLIWFTDMMRSYWPVFIILTAAGVWLGFRYIKTEKGKSLKDKWLLKIPWFGSLVLDFYISNFARTLGSLLKGGVQVLKALEITKDVLNNSVFDAILDNACNDCTGGSSLSTSLKKHKTIPAIVVHMISVGEKGGNLDEMLLKTADVYENQFETGVKKTLNLLEPLMILAMGLVVGFIVLSILLPIFQLNQIIR
ncbi:MAG: type II secretion system inner membrane protein GspF [Deltaproteobacteria bacterium]|nr:type II secretion system inner membrane protein GspF [Deltaproteobacteria bacterium]